MWAILDVMEVRQNGKTCLAFLINVEYARLRSKVTTSIAGTTVCYSIHAIYTSEKKITSWIRLYIKQPSMRSLLVAAHY